MYKNTYYLAKCINTLDKFTISEDSREQYTEVSDIKFFSLEESINKIRPYSKIKKELIQNVENYLQNELDN